MRVESPSPEEIQAQVHKVASSSGFVSSETVRSVFVYLTQQAVEHPGKTVKEYEIATQVLRRNSNFDSRLDSTVRAIASRLRSKLAEYYLHEGLHDPILIELPKGSYALSFSFRETVHAPAAVSAGQAESLEATQTTEQVRAQRSKWPSALLWVLTACLAVACVSEYVAMRRPPKAQVPAPIETFWGDFLRGGDPLMIFPNPTFRGLPETGMKLVEPDDSHADGTIDMLTGTGESMALVAITKRIEQMGHDVTPKRAHLFTWDDANHSNLIFLGGQVQNAAFALLPQLQRFSLKGANAEPFQGQGAVLDSKPASGGQQYYFASKDFNNGNDYAIVALTEGTTPEHRILILAGTNTYGSEGAADFLCNPDLLQGLLSSLGVGPGGRVPPFEALLLVPERGGAPISPRRVLVYKRQPEAANAASDHH
ncbi:hypothetical protein GCM10011507_09640 [Edaphobacter acidisoli]|uniref:Uncharacterized protein n=1 Tax=Edaphobacter acidisoli TaxID=2040573 RepID=A0A916RL19_9BACT|nr:hypothetical protein GCM10011507_09640 [Edaphobacter acidisoli]